MLCLNFPLGTKIFFFFSLREYFLCNSLAIRAFVTLDISKVLCYTFKLKLANHMLLDTEKQNRMKLLNNVLFFLNVTLAMNMVQYSLPPK